MIELLLFLFVIIGGVRIVFVVVIGIVVIGLFIGVLILGDIIICGINLIDGIIFILVGVILIVLIVIIIDIGLCYLEKCLDFICKNKKDLM